MKRTLLLSIICLATFIHCHGQINFFNSGQNLSNISTSVITFDYDDDGDLDLIFSRNFSNTALSTSPEHLWNNDGNGNFIFAQSLTGSSTQSNQIAFADFDNDGDNDLFFTNNNDSFSHTLKNNFGAYSGYDQNIPNQLQTKKCVLGDFDGNGFNDIIISEVAINNLFIFSLYKNFGNGNGTFDTSSPLQVVVGPTTNPSDEIINIEKADIDGDGDLDILLSMVGNNKIFVNDGLGNFSFHQNTETGTTNQVACGDLDNDGDLDIIYAINGPNKVWLNNGSGVFIASAQPIGTANTNAIYLEDFDSDGFLDAIFANNGTNELWLNTQFNAIFSNSGLALGDKNTTGIAVGDFNSDNKNDIVFSNTNTSGIDNSELWFNNSTLSTQDYAISKVSLYPNPTKESFTIETNQNIETVNIFDLQGKLVKTYKDHFTKSYKIHDLLSGVYFVKVSSGNTTTTKKLIKN